MNIIDLATKTMQTAIKSVVDAIKTTTDATKTKVDTTATKVDALDFKVGTLLDGRVVKSVQRGVYSLATASTTASIPISSVNVSKSMVVSDFFLEGMLSSGYNSYDPILHLNSPTTINIIRYVGGYPLKITWQVIEFY